MRLRALAAATALLAGLLTPLVPTPSATAAVSGFHGVVTREGDNAPVQNAGVYLIDVKTFQIAGSTTTAADGSWQMAPQSAGSYYLCVDALFLSDPGLEYADECADNQWWAGPFPNPFGQVQVPASAAYFVWQPGSAQVHDVQLGYRRTPTTLSVANVSKGASIRAGRMTFIGLLTERFTGAPVPQVVVSFSTTARTRVQISCGALTDRFGRAICSVGDGNFLFVPIGAPVHARFNGNDRYSPAEGLATVT